MNSDVDRLKTFRIETVRAEAPTLLHVTWRDRGTVTVDLTRWIESGSEQLADLRRPEIFALASVGHYGTAVVWGDEDGDLAIDAIHLARLARVDAQTDPD